MAFGLLKTHGELNGEKKVMLEFQLKILAKVFVELTCNLLTLKSTKKID